jgi:lipopolysaccharide transport system permease protein
VTAVSTEKVGQEIASPNAGPLDRPLRNTVEWTDSLVAHVGELVRRRELLYLLAQREVKVRYKQTTLGALWAVMQPFSLMLVLNLFLSHSIRMESDHIPYPVFSYAGLLLWTFFSTALGFAVPSLIANSHTITKVYFPREIVPLASVLAVLVDLAVAALVFVGMLAFYRIAPTWAVLYAAPLLVILVVFTTGVCLLLSAVAMLYRDVRFTVPLLTQVWMFATPVVYPVSVVPDRLRDVYLMLNPMAVIIDDFRRAVVYGQPPDPLYLMSAMLVSLAVLWLGYAYFCHIEREFADLA